MQPLSSRDKALRAAPTMAVLYLLDQLHKWLMLEQVQIHARPPIEVTSFFNLVMVWNPGISFGMLRDVAHPQLVLSLLAAIIILALIIWLFKAEHTSLETIAIGMICGGALGNVTDRLRFGAVADFFDFHVMGYHWPAFNIADMAVFCGAMLLLLASFRHRGEQGEQND